MKNKLILILLTIGIFSFSNCENNENEIKGTFISFTGGGKITELKINAGATGALTIPVYTNDIKSVDRTFNISVSAESTSLPANYTLPSSVTIPANSNVGSINLTAKDVTSKLVVEFESMEGLIKGEKLTVNIIQVCGATLKITFDGYASECGYEILNSSNAVVMSGGWLPPYASAPVWADGLASYTTQLCIPNGNYTFKVYDAYGDGLSFPANGNVKITNNATNATLVSIIGNFGYSKSATFTLN